MTTVLSVSVSDKLEEMRKKYNISPTEAFRQGLTAMLARLNEPEYQNQVQEYRTIEKLQQKLTEISEQLERIERRK